MRNDNKNIRVFWKRKIAQIRNSLYVCIPREYSESLGLQKGEVLSLELGEDGTLTIKGERNG